MKLVITDNLTSTKVSVQVGSFIHLDITNVLSKSRGPGTPLGGVLGQGQMVQKDFQGNSS